MSRRGPRPDRVRLAAARLLDRWAGGQEHIDDIVASFERQLEEGQPWEYAERRRLRELVFGAVRYKGRYDQLVELRSDRPRRIPRRLRAVLWVALHEICELSSPDHASVDQAVLVTRTVGQGHAAGFVNALLRRVLREGPKHGIPRPDDDPRGHAEHWLSMPRWIVDRWADRLGEAEMLELVEASDRRPRITLRVPPGEAGAALSRVHGLGWKAELSPWAFDAIRMLDRVPAPLLLAQLGVPAMIQDEGAQLVAPLLAGPGEEPALVVDLCAAPGGKGLHAAQLLPGSRVVAADLSPRRLGPLRDAAGRLGTTNVRVLVADGRAFPLAPGSADAVLVDAPCTGTGVLARRHEARWERDPDDIARLAALQRELLDAALWLVRPGGVVVYATCSLEQEENDDVVDSVLAARDDVEEAGVDGLVDAALVRNGRLMAWPHRHQCDGAFAARLRRRGGEEA